MRCIMYWYNVNNYRLTTKLNDIVNFDEVAKIAEKEAELEYESIVKDLAKFPPKLPTMSDLKQRAINVAKRTVEQVCIKGAVNKAKSNLPLILGGLAVAIVLFFIMKK